MRLIFVKPRASCLAHSKHSASLPSLPNPTHCFTGSFVYLASMYYLVSALYSTALSEVVNESTRMSVCSSAAQHSTKLVTSFPRRRRKRSRVRAREMEEVRVRVSG